LELLFLSNSAFGSAAGWLITCSACWQNYETKAVFAFPDSACLSIRGRPWGSRAEKPKPVFYKIIDRVIVCRTFELIHTPIRKNLKGSNSLPKSLPCRRGFSHSPKTRLVWTLKSSLHGMTQYPSYFSQEKVVRC
jgi:hypothetical protein